MGINSRITLYTFTNNDPGGISSPSATGETSSHWQQSIARACFPAAASMFTLGNSQSPTAYQHRVSSMGSGVMQLNDHSERNNLNC